MAAHHEEHPEYGELGIFAGYGECDPPLKEYPQREIYAYGRYINCQILNWETGSPPKYLLCNPLHHDYREVFLAAQGMGTWMRVDLRDVLDLLNKP